jgi:hypothetical protein
MGHFLSYNRQWILDLCCCIPFPEVASVSRRERQLVKAPPGNEMLHYDPFMPWPKWALFLI